ncbi:uncharacterized protein VTP21DRAFT_8661 [Calcarisporiella thermophila]|uniref:uncharacterized protein n=1 Tax=Calcarisporiella thermophila TaxID=911321 RepID=UPI0037431E11
MLVGIKPTQVAIAGFTCVWESDDRILLLDAPWPNLVPPYEGDGEGLSSTSYGTHFLANSERQRREAEWFPRPDGRRFSKSENWILLEAAYHHRLFDGEGGSSSCLLRAQPAEGGGGRGISLKLQG